MAQDSVGLELQRFEMKEVESPKAMQPWPTLEKEH
jgi:hypothetical protein